MVRVSDDLHFRLTSLLGQIAEEAGLSEAQAQELEDEVVDAISDYEG